jgi:hypothetical protein
VIFAQTNALTYCESLSRLPGSDAHELHLYGLYEADNSERESLLDLPRLHIVNIKGIPPGNYTLTVMRVNVATQGRMRAFDTTKRHGLLAVVPVGVYEIGVSDRAGQDIGLLKNNGNGQFPVRPGEFIVTNAILNGAPGTSDNSGSKKLKPRAMVVIIVLLLSKRTNAIPASKVETSPHYTET